MSKSISVTIEPLGHKFIVAQLLEKSNPSYDIYLDRVKLKAEKRLKNCIPLDEITVAWPIEHEVSTDILRGTELLTSVVRWGKLVDIKDFDDQEKRNKTKQKRSCS